jgi:ubiquinone/menaquinone biosynthesis C-methylase UbiE
MKKGTAEGLIKKTKNDYDLIAEAFSGKREYLWDEMKKFSAMVHDGDRVLDFGCGSGRLVEAFSGKDIKYVGVDISGNLIKEAKRKYPQKDLLTVDLPHSRLPFDDAFFNAVFSIAVFHHIPSKELRKKTMLEIKRVMKPGALLVVSVWNLSFLKHLPALAKYTIRRIFGKIDMDTGDILFPWKDNKGRTVVLRYIHIFYRKELEKMIKECGFSVKKVYLGDGRRNIYIIATKNG